MTKAKESVSSTVNDLRKYVYINMYITRFGGGGGGGQRAIVYETCRLLKKIMFEHLSSYLTLCLHSYFGCWCLFSHAHFVWMSSCHCN